MGGGISIKTKTNNLKGDFTKYYLQQNNTSNTVMISNLYDLLLSTF